MISSSVDIAARLARLERLPAADPGVVSVYLNTRWSDEHQRDRTRVFLNAELRRARAAGAAAPEDLEWIERQGEALIAQAMLPDRHGVALFACRALDLREVIPARVPFGERFVVAERADLGGLGEVLDEQPPALVVFVDGERARLVSVTAGGAGGEVTLAADVPGHHTRGGWAQLAQSRYARHIEVHRAQHLGAVADAVTEIVDTRAIQRIVLAGHEDRLGAFVEHLPPRVRRLVVGQVHATSWESTSAIVDRAAGMLAVRESSEEASELDDLLTEAAKGGRAVAGPGTLAAARRGAIHRLYILAGLRRPARQCDGCGALQEAGDACSLCGTATREVELAAALVGRVQATGGTVETVSAHAGLAAAGGLAARLRYPL